MGGREQEGFYHVDCLFFLWRMDRVHLSDDLIGADQKIPDWLIKITFLVLDIKSRFCIWGFSTGDAILGLWFLTSRFTQEERLQAG